jgi:hypothetical protein
MKKSVLLLTIALILMPWANSPPTLSEIEEEGIKSFTVSNSNPIRNESTTEIPYEVVVYDIEPWTRWDHHIDDWPIDDGESIAYYIYIDNSLLGSELFAFLDIYDAWFSAEPDLDLYIYDPLGYVAAYSENPGDQSEEVSFIADVTGYWAVVVNSFEGDGWFDLYRTVISNAAPKVESWELNTENPFLNEPFAIDLCGSYDPEDGGSDTIDFEWSMDGTIMDDFASCSIFHTLSDTNSHTFTAILSDSFGIQSTESFVVRAVDPGWGDGDGDNHQHMDLGLIGEFGFEQMSGIWAVPDVLSSDNLSLQIGLTYEVQIESDGHVDSTITFDAPADRISLLHQLQNPHQLEIESNVYDLDYDVSFRPSLVLNIWLDNEITSLSLPMISTVEMYEGQSSFSIAGYPLIYYWDDFVELDIDYENGWLNYSVWQAFTLAQVDLYPIIEWMIDNLATSLGQAWVDTATDILGWFVDIEVPLSFQVGVSSAGIQVVRANMACSCSSGEFSEVVLGPDIKYTVFAPATSSVEIYNLDFADEYSLSVVMTSISVVFVEVTPMITLGFEMNGNSLWEETLYEFNGQESQAAATWSSEDSSEFIWEHDSDLDGHPNKSDVFPDDPNEWDDSDGDGTGDNGDVFPNDPTESADSDSDGVGDNADAFPEDPEETEDSDGDGTGDNSDVFPNNPTESADHDSDGVGDNTDAFPLDASENKDTDLDGVGDNSDAFPNDPAESVDSDSDGVGDNADAFPTDTSETKDSDSDGVGDNSDAFPSDGSEWLDSDTDGVGDNADAFPNEASETVDSDSDGVGDNSDWFPNDSTKWDEPKEDSLPGFGALPAISCLLLIAIIPRRRA